MSFSQKSDIGVSPVSVVTTSGKGHPPEFYAERISARLITISENAPPEIKAQALAFEDALKAVVLAGVRGAILSNHTTIINQLRKAGMEEAAALVFEMRN